MTGLGLVRRLYGQPRLRRVSQLLEMSLGSHEEYVLAVFDVVDLFMEECSQQYYSKVHRHLALPLLAAILTSWCIIKRFFLSNLLHVPMAVWTGLCWRCISALRPGIDNFS